MPPLMSWIVALSALGVAIALIAMLVELRRAAREAAKLLVTLEQEIHPLAVTIQDLAEEVRSLSKQVNRELGKIGEVTERIDLLAERLGRLVGLVAGAGRVGKLIGVASGAKKGFDVFVSRLLTRSKID